MVRLSAVAIRMADKPIIVCPFELALDTSSLTRNMQIWCQPGEISEKMAPLFRTDRALTIASHSTWVAPGILRSAAVAAQLVARVTTKTITALMIAVSCSLGPNDMPNIRYCSHNTGT